MEERMSSEQVILKMAEELQLNQDQLKALIKQIKKESFNEGMKYAADICVAGAKTFEHVSEIGKDVCLECKDNIIARLK